MRTTYAAKRASDSNSLTGKEAAKADAAAIRLKSKDETKANMMENMETKESLKELRLACDWLLQN